MELASALVGVLVGGIVASLGTYLTQKHLSELNRIADWADRAASTMADVSLFLPDANPAHMVEVDRLELVPEAWELPRLIGAVQDTAHIVSMRQKVAELATGHPKKSVRDRAQHLKRHLGGLIEREIFLVDLVIERRSPDYKVLNHAIEYWKQANHDQENLVDALHGS